MMAPALTSLVTQHDHGLLALAIVVCVVESFIAFYVYWQVSQTHTQLNRIWIVFAGLCTGGSIWATHFIAALAYRGDVPTRFDPALSALSFLVAIAATTLGFAVASSRKGWWRAAAGGMIMGLGTAAAIHLTGMLAMQVPGDKEWDLGIIAAGVGLDTALTVAALLVFHREPRLRTLMVGSGLIVLGVAILHFTAMSALTVTLHEPHETVRVGFSQTTVAIAVTIFTVLVIGGGCVIALQEGRATREAVLTTRELVNAATEALVLACDGVVSDANRCASDLWGQPVKDLRGRTVFGDLLTGAPPEPDREGIYTLETYLKGEGGQLIPVEVQRRPLFATSRVNEAYAVKDLRPLIATTQKLRRMNDELQARKRELWLQNTRLDTALTHMTQGLCMFDAEGRIAVANRRYAELYGLSPDQVKPGTTLDEVIQARIASGIFAGNDPQAYREERHTANREDIDMVQELNDGRTIAITLRKMPGGGYVSTHEDITERRRIELRLRHMAHYDPLTDLPNRYLLRDKLEAMLRSARKGQASLVVMMLGLDRFKEINDTMGHMAGDELLKAIAGRLREGLRSTALVSRFGGDEFAVVESLGPGETPETLVPRIQEIVEAPLEVAGHCLSVGTTIGVALAPNDGGDPETLLKHADLALYQAKSEHKGNYRLFDPAIEEALYERRALEQDLRQALLAGQLALHYQPLVNLESDEISGFEALMRWHHPVHGPIAPSTFIPIAEDTGQICALTEWALREACAEAMRWPGNQKVAVNLSAHQFRARSLLPLIIGALSASRLPPNRLEVEITETVMLNDPDEVFALFRQIHQLGVRIALDDFGTGFSSLSYLLRFPFDKLKIDRSFVSGIAGGGNSLVLVRALVQMARGLGVATTAEGIETKEQLDILAAEGCTEGQGYYIGQPVPAGEIRQSVLHPRARRRYAVA